MLGVAYGSRSRVESDMKFTHKHHARHAFCGTKAQFGVIQLESMNWADVPTRASHAEGRWFDHSQDHEVRRLGGGPRRTSLRIAYLPSPACPVANCVEGCRSAGRVCRASLVAASGSRKSIQDLLKMARNCSGFVC